MRRTNTPFYEGFVSSFFLQPSKFHRKTQHTNFELMNSGSVQQDWLKVGGYLKHANQKIINELEPTHQKRLQSIYYRYV